MNADIPIRRAELVMVGTELMLGQITDTNAVFLARRLSDLGIDLHFKSTIGDNMDRMVETIGRAASRADLVIVGGGLGPTEDDLTREAIARVAEKNLELRDDMLKSIEERFAEFGVAMTDNNRRQAYAPVGAIHIHNPVGTAPAFAVEVRNSIIVALPGVPREMKYLWENGVVPLLRDLGLLSTKLIRCRMLKVCGAGESRVDTMVGDLVKSGENPTVGLLASPGQVSVRLAAKAGSEAEADALLDEMEAKVRDRLGDIVFGTDDDTLTAVIGKLIEERGWRLAVVDALTGGTAVSMLAADAPNILAGTYVLPNAETIKEFVGAEDWSCESLAATARNRSNADIVLVLGTAEGTNQAYASGPDIDHTHKFAYPADSGQARRRIAFYSMEMLRRQITRNCRI